MEKYPLVTVLIPVYNRPGIVNTIKSICEQTYSNLEIIVVDNASTDETVKVIRKIHDKRIKVLVNQENRGQTFSLNRGLKEAKGKYIARIDSDDIAFPDRIQKQVDFMEKNPDFVLVGSFVQFISDSDEIGMVVRMPTSDKGMRFMHTFACGMYHPSAMYRSQTIHEHDVQYNEYYKMAEDYDLWDRLMLYGKASNLPEPLIFYRRGNNNDSRIYVKRMTQESTEIRRRVCGRLNNSKELFSEIDLEEKKGKSVFDCIKIYKTMMKQLDDALDKRSIDYSIVKQHLKIKIYSSCFATSERWYALIVRYAYRLLRDYKNRVGGKHR